MADKSRHSQNFLYLAKILGESTSWIALELLRNSGDDNVKAYTKNALTVAFHFRNDYSVRMRFSLSILTSILLVFTPLAANAGLVRDAEIEYALRAYANPIFDAADIPPSNVRILIVDDPSINAYVAGGLNLFIHTGLIRAATSPSMLIGVIAHETGHIAGAHLSQFSDKSTRATLGAAIGTLAGVAAVIAGAGQAGAGVIAGSNEMAKRRFISDIRWSENSADQAALTFLDRCGYSAQGMLKMFETLRQREATMNTQTDPFLIDHPLTADRITAMQNHIAQMPMEGDGMPSNFAAMHARVIAKLVGFTDSYEQSMIRYPKSDTSVAARYARAIAEFKNHNLSEALAGMNALLKQYPNDAFFYDTKGQILFENGRLEEAAKAYANATRLMPKSALMLTDYARTLIAQEKPEHMRHATELLEKSVSMDDSYDTTWRQLAIAYGKQGQLGRSDMALAEEAALAGDYKTVLQHVARARQDPHANNALQLRLDDIERDAKAQLKSQREGKIF